jgi:hypothetical protein
VSQWLQDKEMKRLLTIAAISLSLVLFHIPNAGAIFGIGQCSKVSKSIKPIESRVQSGITYINGLWLARPSVDSAQGVKLYEKYLKVESDLKKIRSLALSKPKCFSPGALALVNDVQYWSLNHYLYLGSVDRRYYVMSYKNYIPLTFK